jgi:hypothetical protein
MKADDFRCRTDRQAAANHPQRTIPDKIRNDIEEIIMAKGQKRSNREIRKPKKTKESTAAPSTALKGLSASIGVPKKKG